MSQHIDLKEPIRKEIENKYHNLLLSSEIFYPTRSSMVVDSFFPSIFNSYLGGAIPNQRDRAFDSQAVAIGEFTAVSLGVKRVHISELLKILDVSEKYIKDVLLAVKRKDIYLKLAGFGGTGINFNYWLSELAGLTETVNIFRHIDVYDADDFSVSNTLRIPYYLEASLHSGLGKVLQFDNSRHITRSFYLHDFLIDKEFLDGMLEKGIFYGAPTITTRQMFSETDHIFVSATHQDRTCSLDINPMQDDSIQVETYGKIDLSSFFMNHLMMTIKFMEWLADTDLEDESLRRGHVKIMDYSFEPKEYKTSKRMYRFPTEGK